MTALTTPPAGEEGEFNAARLREIHSFLLGEGPLDGRWFGDDPPVVNGRKQPYWWRSCLRAALLSSPRVEREWCLNCGTVTRDHRCHCTEIGKEPHFVNYADELARQMNAAASPSTEGEGEAYIENDHARFQDEIDRLTRELEAARVDARRKPMEGHSKPLEVMARALPYVTIPLKVTEGGKVTTNGTTVSGLLNAGLGGGPFVFLLVEQVCQAIAEAALTALQAEGMAVVPGWQPIESAPADGTSVLVFGGHFCQPTIAPADGEWWRMGKAGGLTVPTHWMPLPTPPAHTQEKDA